MLKLDPIFRKFFKYVINFSLESEKVMEAFFRTLNLLNKVIGPSKAEIFNYSVHIFNMDNLSSVSKLVKLGSIVSKNVKIFRDFGK